MTQEEWQIQLMILTHEETDAEHYNAALHRLEDHDATQRSALAEKDAEIASVKGRATVALAAQSKQLEELQAELDRVVGLLSELHTVVRGECPSLLNEDSGGDAELDWNINKAIRSWRARQGKETI